MVQTDRSGTGSVWNTEMPASAARQMLVYVVSHNKGSATERFAIRFESTPFHFARVRENIDAARLVED